MDREREVNWTESSKLRSVNSAIKNAVVGNHQNDKRVEVKGAVGGEGGLFGGGETGGKERDQKEEAHGTEISAIRGPITIKSQGKGGEKVWGAVGSREKCHKEKKDQKMEVGAMGEKSNGGENIDGIICRGPRKDGVDRGGYFNEAA